MNENACVSCYNSKTTHNCGLCAVRVCKKCVKLSSAENFDLYQKIPAALEHHAYCPTCYEDQIIPLEEEYQAMVETAKDLVYFSKVQGKETRLISRTEKPIKIENCLDRQEVIMKLAFRAVELGFNALVDLDVKSEKVRNGGYQSQRWQGTASPVNIDRERYEERDRRRMT